MPPAARRPPRRASPGGPEDAAAAYDARPWLAHYPDGVPPDFDFPHVPVTRLLDDAAASFPTAAAVTFLGTTLTYRELRRQVDALAASLHALGVRKGDRVAVVLPPCPQNVVTFFAVLRLGAVVVQCDPASTESALRTQLVDCGAVLVVCLDRVHPVLARVLPATGVQRVVVTSLLDYLPAAERVRLRLPLAASRRARARLEAPVPRGTPVLRFPALLRAAGIPSRQTPLDADVDLALVQYTAGTSGPPRGAMLTHAHVVSDTYRNRLWDTGATAGREVVLGVLPLFGSYALTVGLLTTVLLSGTFVLLPRFDADEVLDAVAEHGVTVLPGVPPIFRALADRLAVRPRELPSLRLAVSGTMPLPLDVQEAFERTTGARLVQGYGTTEASPRTHAVPTTGERRPGTIGLPLTGTRCRVLSLEDPTTCVPVGMTGELAVQGPQVFRGWWDAPEEVAAPDGWLRTGDAVVMDEDGWFTVVDRLEDLVVTDGVTVAPAEVESVLLAHPGVQEAAVVGVPDRSRGESLRAVVVAPGVDAATLLAHCRTQLSAEEVPRSIEVRPALPRSGVGTLLRRVLREELTDPAQRSAAPRTGVVPGGVVRTPEPELPTGPPPPPREAGSVPPERPARRAAARKAPARKAPAGQAPARQASAGTATAGEPAARTVTRKAAAAGKPVRDPVADKPVVRKTPAGTPAAGSSAPGTAAAVPDGPAPVATPSRRAGGGTRRRPARDEGPPT